MNKMKVNGMKTLAIISLCIALLGTVCAGCGSATVSSNNATAINDNTQKKQIPELTGEWKQTNSTSQSRYQTATISGDVIEIYWVTDNGESKALYWAGSFVAPTTTDEPYTWSSKNDHVKTDVAFLASTDDTKTLTYQDGVLSYSTSAMGMTTTVKLEKQK